ncbi:hypothetical protein K505DRAFT_328016 [Melanomma pulvis-pyrius CBS 109.77]|uniref:Uncharacterized protein n=1 Tax=Melanomma pulvis-pyrius CBS 109.77 TaxID=1314802 RepID=A0A6A6X0Q9_9PLEO|nr:hypothetical protein K505DRAFT_328016 [Melanomma pulvis-pyrius CBS 109.77]
MARAAPPPASSVLLRQFSSFPLVLLLWTAATPFTPTAWLLGDFSGAMIVDRFVAGLILLCACYFQFKASSLTHPIAVAIPNPLGASQGEPYVYNGRMRYPAPSDKSAKSEFTFLYHPEKYWTYGAVEAGLLLLAEFSGFEYLRRAVVVAVLGALWAVGWYITPAATKRWAWGHIKVFWFFVVWDLIKEVGFGGGGGGRRRGRRG